MKERGEGTFVYKGFHLIDGVPICSKGGAKWTEYKVGKYVSAPSNTPLRLCENGIHVCLEPLDCLHFYEPADSNMVLPNRKKREQYTYLRYLPLPPHILGIGKLF